MVPAFEMSCKAMFEQVDATFQKGMAEHTTSVQQNLESGHTSLEMALKVSILAPLYFTFLPLVYKCHHKIRVD